VILLALLQAVSVPAAGVVTRATSAAPAERFSILAQPCGRASGETVGNDIVVCGRDADVQRLPLPDERGPSDRATPSNPYLRADVALAAEGTPCAATQRGCQVGIGGPLLAAGVKGLVTAISDGVADAKVRKARRQDAGKRVAIPLNEPAAR
jgi:hypothetical protein